jgi:D-3-phosphoglycerate dehydrogenase
VLLNFSRDGIIDHRALQKSLTSKKIFKYVSDFPHQSLREYEQVISLPHLGASTREAEENCAVTVAKQIRNFLECGGIGSSVNFPMVEVSPQHALTRLAIVNENVPNMVAKISSALGSAEFNIVSLINKSKNNIAYTLIDLDHDVKNQMLEVLREIEGVVQVRKIIA